LTLVIITILQGVGDLCDTWMRDQLTSGSHIWGRSHSSGLYSRRQDSAHSRGRLHWPYISSSDESVYTRTITYLYRAAYKELTTVISLTRMLKTATPLPFAAIDTPREPVHAMRWTRRFEQGDPMALKKN
jgi:hypothetical protein